MVLSRPVDDTVEFQFVGDAMGGIGLEMGLWISILGKGIQRRVTGWTFRKFIEEGRKGMLRELVMSQLD